MESILWNEQPAPHSQRVLALHTNYDNKQLLEWLRILKVFKILILFSEAASRFLFVRKANILVKHLNILLTHLKTFVGNRKQFLKVNKNYKEIQNSKPFLKVVKTGIFQGTFFFNQFMIICFA